MISKFIFVLLLVSVVLVSGCTEQPPSQQDPCTIIECKQGETCRDGKCIALEVPDCADGQTGEGCDLVPSDGTTKDTSPSDSTGPADSGSTNQPESQVKEISMTAKKFEFNPSTITVKKADQVKLTIKSLDVTHGFSIPDLNVNANLDAGKETVVEFTPDKTGTFTFVCSVFCGSGHSGMKGTLIVE